MSKPLQLSYYYNRMTLISNSIYNNYILLLILKSVLLLSIVRLLQNLRP